jgi:hypothetical protein
VPPRGAIGPRQPQVWQEGATTKVVVWDLRRKRVGTGEREPRPAPRPRAGAMKRLPPRDCEPRREPRTARGLWNRGRLPSQRFFPSCALAAARSPPPLGPPRLAKQERGFSCVPRPAAPGGRHRWSWPRASGGPQAGGSRGEPRPLGSRGSYCRPRRGGASTAYKARAHSRRGPRRLATSAVGDSGSGPTGGSTGP